MRGKYDFDPSSDLARHGEASSIRAPFALT